MNQNQNDLGDQPPSQQQSLGDVQLQGDGNVFNTVQGRDVQVINLTVYDRIPKNLGQLPISTLKSSTEKDDRFRKVLLNKVKNYWVQDVLEKSLHARVLIELGLEERLDAVKDSFKHFQAIPAASKRSLLKTKNVVEVFHQMGEGRTLLILGEPGTGKTITLLRLAKDLIARTEQDISQPIPVVLNLASWALKPKPISIWLVEELSSKYQVSKNLGKAWVADQQLLLLLDGLDEVKAERREACIQYLNQFMQDYGQTEIVVCSRWQDYEVLSTRLQVQTAIYLQSLTPEQVSLYLEGAGDQLKTLKVLLQNDRTLQELAQSPLMLSVMSLAYQHKVPEEIPHMGTVEENHRHLFDAYIQQMFWHRSRGSRLYTKAKMIRWLVKLAQQMTRESQTIFLIERMQPSWLKQGKKVFLYRIGLVLVGGLSGGLVSGLTGGLSGGLSCKSGLIWNWGDGLKWGLVLGLLGAGIGALTVAVGKGEIKTIETFEVSWTTFTKSLVSKHTLIKGLIGAVIGAVGLGLCSWLTNYFIWKLILLGLSWGLVFGLVLGVSSGLTGLEIETRTVPNQGIWRSALNASWVGLSFGLIIALLAELAFALMGLNNTCRLIALPIILVGFGGLGVLVNEAGKACIRHFTLRLVLFSQGIIPWNYSRFLDCAVEDIFLHQAGGTYFFIHRMLMEHFARMEPMRK
ncbi:NACHT domain-containing protein [Nostoc sp. LPT]|uniref:NACHT domain-containing protein n=1 Tax=Nostoc sp. LPT TaxID=2815387 RepID=UPI001D2A3D07|nr:NACHT domain-containing protein [Nostoc sp. LPT]MBN4003834.1 NACHT domain-containing protein [Nostoc sp. LPT]